MGSLGHAACYFIEEPLRHILGGRIDGSKRFYVIDHLMVEPSKSDGNGDFVMMGISPPFDLRGPDPDEEMPAYDPDVEMPEVRAIGTGDVITQVAGQDVKPEDFVAFWSDGTFGIYIHPGIWHEGVFPVTPGGRFFDKQGKVHARISCDLAREFGVLLGVQLPSAV